MSNLLRSRQHRAAYQSARHSRQLTDTEYAQRAMCGCALLPSGHQALHCAQLREQTGGAQQ